jgi:hypothetical protein
MGARTSDELARLWIGRNPWTEEPWTWLRDGTSPQRSETEQTAERLRKPEGGT